MKAYLYKNSRLRLYWFSIKSKNGKIVATSEMYTRKASAIKTAKKLAPVVDKTGEKK